MRKRLAISVSVILVALLGCAAVTWGVGQWLFNRRPQIIPIGSPSPDSLIAGATQRIRRDPQDWEAYIDRALFQMMRGDSESARADLLHIADAAPPRYAVVAWKRVGMEEFNAKRYEAAVDSFTHALDSANRAAGNSEVQKEVSVLFEYRALARFKIDDFNASLDDCESSLNQGGNRCNLYRLRAMNELKMKKWQEALESVRLSGCIENVDIVMIRALAFSGEGRIAEADVQRLRAYAIDKQRAQKWETFLGNSNDPRDPEE